MPKSVIIDGKTYVEAKPPRATGNTVTRKTATGQKGTKASATKGKATGTKAKQSTKGRSSK